MSDVSIEFGNIIETPTIFPKEQGKLEIIVTNQGSKAIKDATIDLYASTDAILDIDPTLDDRGLNNIEDTLSRPENDLRPPIPTGIDALEGTDELLGSFSGVSLAAGDEATFTIDFANDLVASDTIDFISNDSEFRTASVVSAGAYNLIAEVNSNLDGGDSQAVQFISSDSTDVVLDWNSMFLNAVQAEGKAELNLRFPSQSNSLDDIPGVAPPVEARNGAILHLAIYDSVYALSEEPTSSDIVELPDAPAEASQEAAVVGSSYTVLSRLFPEQEAIFAEQRERSLADISDNNAAKKAGFNFGVDVAEAILDERNYDGASFAQAPYKPGTAAGDYKEIKEPNPVEPLPDNLTEEGLVETTALLPYWGRIIPFAIDSTAAFRPQGQPNFSSRNYAQDLEEVRRKGALTNTEQTTVNRTEDETEIAQFWSYDRPDTFRPPGQWNQIAQEVAIDFDNSLEANALLFAQLNVAMADAGIVAWDAKYAYEQLRPVTAIRNADNDNNPYTTADSEWEPLIGTPDFPDYISGHSAFGGAAAGVLEDFFGEDKSFEISSQELPGISRSFTSMGNMSSFEVAARENADSRLFGGVHVDISNVDGVSTGLYVADFVLNESGFFI